MYVKREKGYLNIDKLQAHMKNTKKANRKLNKNTSVRKIKFTQILEKVQTTKP